MRFTSSLPKASIFLPLVVAMALTTLPTAQGTPSSSCSIQNQTMPAGGKTYEYNYNCGGAALTWSDAKDACSMKCEGCQLAIIQTTAEQQAVEGAMITAGRNGGWAWIGANLTTGCNNPNNTGTVAEFCDGAKRDGVWVDDSPYNHNDNFSKWEFGQPQGYINYKCLQVFDDSRGRLPQPVLGLPSLVNASIGSLGFWDDYTCSTLSNYICEYPADTGPVIFE